MSNCPAPVETENLQDNENIESNGEPNNIVTFPGQFHREAVKVISDNLTKAGHQRFPEQVSAHGEANAILANIENEGIGAEIIDIKDRLKKGVKNLVGDISGSQDIYETEGSQTGHRATMNRMAKKVRKARIAERIRHLLFTDKKAA